MPVTLLDLILLGVMLISGLLAMVRGFMREILSIAAWGAAAIVTLYSFSKLLPTAKTYFNNDTVASVVVVAGVFVGTLIVVSIITVKLSDAILDSRIGALDRTLGFVFGAARGLLICVIGWVFFAWLAQGKMPEWAAQARTRPLLENSGNSLVAMLPDNPEGLLKNLKKPRPDSDTAEPPTEASPPIPPRRSETPARADERHAVRQIPGVTTR